jgi:DNA-binding response OmpR family regulator
LLIEDDARIRAIVERGLTARGFAVTCAPDGELGAELAATLSLDVVLLDLLLPGRHGLEVLTDIRAVKPRLPIIALTALDDMASRVGGLDAGADDYVTKPFAMEELAARIRARLRHQGADDADVITVGDLTIDTVAHRAAIAGRTVDLSARELALLAVLARHLGQVLSRSQLLDRVWGITFDPGSNVVDVYVAALRRKLGPGWIETVRGLGYRFVADVPRGASA